MNEELVFQASLLQQEAEKIQEHLDLVEKQLSELEQLSKYLTHLNASKEKTIISSLGKGIHVKTELAEKKLFVEVGSGIVIRKTPEQTLEVIESQLKSLKAFKTQLLVQKVLSIRALNEAIMEIRQESQEKKE